MPEFPDPKIHSLGIDSITALISGDLSDIWEEAVRCENGWRRTSDKNDSGRIRTYRGLRCYMKNIIEDIQTLSVSTELSRYKKSTNTFDRDSNNINALIPSAPRAFIRDVEKIYEKIGLEGYLKRYDKITKLDVFFDLSTIPSLENLIIFTTKNRNMLMRIFKDGYVYEFRPKKQNWNVYASKKHRARTPAKELIVPPVQDFCINEMAFKKALMSGDIVIYVQNKSRKVRIYRKKEYRHNNVIRFEASYFKAITCRPILGLSRQPKKNDPCCNLLRLLSIDVLKGVMINAWKDIKTIFNDDDLNSAIEKRIEGIINSVKDEINEIDPNSNLGYYDSFQYGLDNIHNTHFTGTVIRSFNFEISEINQFQCPKYRRGVDFLHGRKSGNFTKDLKSTWSLWRSEEILPRGPP